MLAALLVAGVLAAPGGKAVPAYQKDVDFALAQIEKDCGSLLKTKGIVWKDVRKEFKKAAKDARTDQDFYMLLVRMIARLRDGHAGVIIAEGTKGVAWPDRGEWRGPGMFWFVSGNDVFVKNAFSGARSAGVTPGMKVLEVDGEPALKWLDALTASLSETRSFSTDQQARFFACHWGLAGPAGSRLSLKLRGVDRKGKKATISRTSKSYVPSGPAFFPEGLQRTGRQSYGKLPSGFGYIHLRDVKNGLPEQLDTMLTALGELPGLVLDCRGNGGGGCDHGAVYRRFLPTKKAFDGGKGAGPAPYAGPLVVLIDPGVRSAGETISGMFKENGRAYMIGTGNTAGMSSSKKTIELPSKKFSLFVSIRSNGRNFNQGRGIEGIGVTPHEVVPYDPKDLDQGKDTLILRAEALLAAGFPKKSVAYVPAKFGWKAPE